MALLIRAEELTGLINIDDAISAVRKGFYDHGLAPHYSSPRIRLQHEDRRLSVHPGGCVSLETAGVFIHAERFTFENNSQQYTNAGKRIYVAYDSETAELQAIIVGSLPLFEFDNPIEQFATETSITSAVGTDLLARKDCRVMALLGTGRQARRHLITMKQIRPLEQVRVFSRSKQNREDFVDRMAPFVDLNIVLCNSEREAVHGADLICCATGSNVAALHGDLLVPGQHITSIVNSNKGVKEQAGLKHRRRELDDDVVVRADIIAVNILEQSIIDEHGDLFEPVERGLIKWRDCLEIGQLLIDESKGRKSQEDITLYKQNSDQGVGFMALASLAYDVAKKHGIGIEI
tara:strand:+ start:778 stop:1821 length:1044 start_codon:yes stop_codon:yes gene_type:complete